KPSAPASLAGMSRSDVHLVGQGRDAGALVTYGHNLDGVAVLETPAQGKAQLGLGSSSPSGEQPGVKLPSASINGISGQELDTALGTLVRFRRAGIDNTVVGSVHP